VSLRECVAPEDDAPCLLLDPRAEQSLGSINNPTHRLTVLIGPEGGLCAQEIAHAERLGFQRVRLGSRTLRTETAALVAITAAQLLWGDLFETH
jgi:16S rRNA (uracil1498-N3)-methyltransferase